MHPGTSALAWCPCRPAPGVTHQWRALAPERGDLNPTADPKARIHSVAVVPVTAYEHYAMPFIRRKRGQVLVVHSRRAPSGKVQQQELASFTSPEDLRAVLEGEAWEPWCRALSWRHPELSWDWAKIEAKLRDALVAWEATPSGKAIRSQQRIARLCGELSSSVAALSSAVPGDQLLLKQVRPALLELSCSLQRTLEGHQEIASPLSRSRTPMHIDPTTRQEDAEHLFEQGMEHWWSGNRAAACKLYRKAIAFDPTHADAHNHLGIASLDRGRLSEAAKHFGSAIEGGVHRLVRDHGLVEWGHLENRPYLRGLHNLALVHARRDEHAAAVRIWEQLLTLCPNDNQGVRFLLGEGYHRLDRLDDAIVAYERALEEPGCCYGLAMALHEQGEQEHVGVAFVRAFARNRYVASMLLGERWERAPGRQATNMAEPEWASDYVKRSGDLWRRVEGGAELLRKWWQAAPVQSWLKRQDELRAQMEDLPPGDDLRSLLIHKKHGLEAEATLRKIAAEVDPGPSRSRPYRHPFVATLDQVHISRDGEDAIIEYRDPEVWTTQLKVGPQIDGLSDQEVLDMHNEMVEAARARREENPYAATEVPPGSPQLEFDEGFAQWRLRGEVLRARIDDREEWVQLDVDGQSLNMEELQQLLAVYSGWGLRLVIVPDDEIERQPTIVVREPAQ